MHEEGFRKAQYPGLLDGLDTGEQSIAGELSKSGRREDEVIWQIINYRMYRQIHAIAAGKGTSDGIMSWVHLFNAFMKCGAFNQGCDSSLLLHFAIVERFAPYFIDHILTCIDHGRPGFEVFKEEKGRMACLLEQNREKPVFDDDSFAQFLQWVQLYQSVTPQVLDEGG